MAKTQVADKKAVYVYPTRYGSSRSMVIRELDGGKVICKDEFGEYETDANRLDDGTADPARFDLPHRKVSL